MKPVSMAQQSSEETAKMQNLPISIATEPPKPIASYTELAGAPSKPWGTKRPFCERLRVFEEYILAHLEEIRCPVHLSLGQELVSEAIHRNILKGDWLFSTHRNHGHYLAKGGSEDRLWDEICGLETGINRGMAGSQCFSDPAINFHASSIVGGSIGIAVGAAFSLKGSGNLVVCCLGDAATEQGVFWEALNFSALKKLPIFFICENNRLSIDVPIVERQTVGITRRVKTWIEIAPTIKQGFEMGRIAPMFHEAFVTREGKHCYFQKK